MATLAFVLTHPAVEDIGINVMAYGQRSQRYATSQILRHQFCFELRTVTPAPANLLGIVLCHYKHPLIISWVLSLAYFDAAEKMPSPDAYEVHDDQWLSEIESTIDHGVRRLRKLDQIDEVISELAATFLKTSFLQVGMSL